MGVKNQMSKLFWAMLSFITRLPVPRRWSRTGFRALFSRYYFFSFNWIIAWHDQRAGLHGAAGMVSRTTGGTVSRTGAGADDRGFHLDGLADTCDGVFSARSRDRMLEIMRDSRLGTHGGLALIFVVLAKILVLSGLLCVANRSLHRWRQHLRSAAGLPH
ncbi:adenosylcobinamide-GDP ribazoletransferase [Escherichia coli]